MAVSQRVSVGFVARQKGSQGAQLFVFGGFPALEGGLEGFAGRSSKASGLGVEQGGFQVME